MRVDEFANSSSNPEDNLVTALELIRNRYKDDETQQKLSKLKNIHAKLIQAKIEKERQ